MRMIVLAAGQGARLRPITSCLPKCLVKLKNKPLLEWIIDNAHRVGIENIGVVSGYKAEQINKYNVQHFDNKNHLTTNMLYSLLCAEKFIGSDDTIISYSDIYYEEDHLKKLVINNDEITVLIDKEWLSYWNERFDDPTQDAESLRLDGDNNIIEIGRKINSLECVHGQYIGLIKVSSKISQELFSLINKVKEDGIIINGRGFNEMYMTDLLDYIAKNKIFTMRGVYVNRGWVEIDDVNDLKLAEKISFFSAGQLKIYRNK